MASYLSGVAASVLIAWGWAIHRLATRGRLGESVGLPRPGWPSWAVPVFLIGHALALVIGTSAWMVWVLSRSPRPEDSSPQLVMQSAVVGNLAVVVVLGGLTLAIRTGRPVSREFGLDLDRRSLTRAVGIGVWGVLLVLPWVYVASWLAIQIWSDSTHPLETMLRERKDWTTVLLAILAGCVLAPLTEEWLFRGILLPMFTRWGSLVFSQATRAEWVDRADQDDWGDSVKPRDSDTGLRAIRDCRAGESGSERLEAGRGGVAFWVANGLVAGLFAALHATEWPAPVPIFLMALSLGEMARRSGSLLAPVVAHVLFNANSVVLVMVMSGNPPAEVGESPALEAPAAVVPVEKVSESRKTRNDLVTKKRRALSGGWIKQGLDCQQG